VKHFKSLFESLTLAGICYFHGWMQASKHTGVGKNVVQPVHENVKLNIIIGMDTRMIPRLNSQNLSSLSDFFLKAFKGFQKP